jgi:hypothetical protein
MNERSFFSNVIIAVVLLGGGFYILNNWLISEFGVVGAWRIKQSLISAKAVVYAVFVIAALYIAAKFKSAKVLLTGFGIIAAVPLCAWLHDFLGHQYFLIIGKVFFYALVTLAAAWSVAAIVGGPVAFLKRLRMGHLEDEAEIKAEQAKALKLFAEARSITENSRYATVSGPHVVVLDNYTGECRQYIAPPKSMLVEEEEVGLQQNSIEIFEKVYQRTQGEQNAPCAVVAGRKRSGKSTFVEELTYRYESIEWYIIDPKQKNPKAVWGPKAVTLGHGDDWPEVSEFVDWLYGEQKRREANVKKLEDMPKLIVVIDELLTVLAVKENKYGEKFAHFYQTILTKMSWLGIGVFVLPHSTTSTALGFKPGYAQLRECFDGIFRFKYSLKDNIRQSFFEFDDEEMEVPLYRPMSRSEKLAAHRAHRHTEEKNGGYRGCAGAPAGLEYDPDATPEEPAKPQTTDFYESRTEKIIIEAHRAGHSKRAICEMLGMSSGGTASAEINRVLRKYSVGAGV